MRKQKSTRTIVPLIVLLVLIFAVGVYLAPEEVEDVQYPFDVSTEGYSVVDVNIDGSTLSLSSECYTLSMDINDVQAFSIDKGIEKKIDTRPLTHDIIKDILDNFDIEILIVKIESYNNGIFYANLMLRQGNKVLDIDSRPSDAIGVAVREGVDVYVKDELLIQYGSNTCG